MQKHTILSSQSIGEALEKINSLAGNEMTLFAVDRIGHVAGSVTDGDIRRGLIAGAALTDDVAKVMRRDFLRLRSDEGSANLHVFRQARALGVKLLPVLDAESRLSEVIVMSRRRSILPLDGVLMAGGKGMRLRPLTLRCPKPLLPVGDRPIIDHNVAHLRSFGVRKIFVTVNYLHEMIERHFATDDTEEHRDVECVRETSPLGTFGSLSLVEGLSHDNLIVMNADIFTDIDLEAMYLKHVAEDADLTVAAVPYSVSVPYAILSLENGRVKGLEEKPTYNYFANAGVYILRKRLIDTIRKGERLDATDFMETLLVNGGKISYYPIEGSWTDIGSPDDYRCVCELTARKKI